MHNDDQRDDVVAQLIDSALTKGLISSHQAASLREEMFMYPGGNLVSIMVRRGMISPDQGKDLEYAPRESAQAESEDSDIDFGFTAATPDTTTKQRPVQVTPSPLQPAPPRRMTPPPQPAVKPAPVTPRLNTQAPQFTFVEKEKPAPASGIRPDPEMVRLFRAGRERGCSDLHLTVGKPPYFRQQGKIFFMEGTPLTPETARQWSLSVLTNQQRAELEQQKQVDFSFECPGAGRFRANVFHQRLGVEAAFRFIPDTVPTLESLQLPKVLEKLTSYPQGLNLVTGPGGCGKTTTVAAMLEFINNQRHDHIITVEDPVEYILRPKNCQITQREVGTHTGSFANALRTALRQDPDVIMIGELRDLETTSISITAAETGHLVFGTLHTSSAARTVARILDVYPPSQRGQICLMIAESLRGIISQQLIERKDGRGRACAMEILLITTGVSQVIKEGKTHQLISHMQSGRKLGMISLDDSLMELVQTGVISGAEAYNRAENKGPFEMLRNM